MSADRRAQGGFTKEDSLCLKGIGILLMIFFHLFNDYEEYAGYQVIYAPFSAHRLTQLAQLSNLCVALFVFVTGYGLSVSYVAARDRGDLTSAHGCAQFCLRRWWALMTQYWFVFAVALLYQPFGKQVATSYGQGALHMARGFALDAMGISFVRDSGTLNPSWWYMTLAIWFVFHVPIVNALVDRLGLPAALTGTAALTVLLGHGVAYEAYCLYGLVVLVGVAAARSGALVWLGTRLTSNVRRWSVGLLAIVAFCGLMVLRLRGVLLLGLMDGLTALTCALICQTLLAHGPLARCLRYLGTHATTMFLTHDAIYGYAFLGFFFSFGYWWLILAVLVAVSLAVSVVFEHVKRVSGYNAAMARVGEALLGPSR